MTYYLGILERTKYAIISLTSIPTATAAAIVKNVIVFSLAKLKMIRPNHPHPFGHLLCKVLHPNKWLTQHNYLRKAY